MLFLQIKSCFDQTPILHDKLQNSRHAGNHTKWKTAVIHHRLLQPLHINRFGYMLAADRMAPVICWVLDPGMGLGQCS
jgi:hypothetical protein